MKNFWIPSGTAYFPGNYTDLLRVIGRIYGTMEDEHSFRCVFPSSDIRYGRLVLFRVRGRLQFLFRCNIERRDDSFKITYSVYPTHTFILALLIIVCAFVISTLHSEPKELIGSLLGSVFVAGILLVAFLVNRCTAIRRFVRMFEECDESNFV